MDKQAMKNLSYGLFILTAREGDKDHGCIISHVMQVTTEFESKIYGITAPDRIIIVVNKRNHTHYMIQHTGIFNLSVLTKQSKHKTYEVWGTRRRWTSNKVEGFNFRRSQNGVIYLVDGVNAYISARVVSETDLGTHTLFLADVVDSEVISEEESITYDDYLRKIRYPEIKKALMEIIELAKDAEVNDERCYHPYGGWNEEVAEKYNDFIGEYLEYLIEIFSQDISQWPDWANAYSQVYNWEFEEAHEGIMAYYENICGNTDPYNVQRAITYLKNNGYEELGEFMGALADVYENPEAKEPAEGYPYSDEWIGEHIEDICTFYLEEIIKNEQVLLDSLK